MRKTIEVEVEVDDLIQEAISRYHLHSAREAIFLALRTLLADGDGRAWQQDSEYDEFGDLSAWEPHRRTDTG